MRARKLDHGPGVVSHLVSFIALAAGVCAGAAFAVSDAGSTGDVMSYMESGFALIRSTVPTGQGRALVESLKANLGSLGLIWICGLSVVGFPGILVVLAARGFSAGFTVAFMVRHMGGAGVALAATSVLPHNLIAAPVMVVASASSLRFSAAVIGQRLASLDTQPSQMFTESARTVALCSLAAGAASFIQAFVSPSLVILASRLSRLG